MRLSNSLAAVAAATCCFAFLLAGCQKQNQQPPAPTAAFKTALDTWYQSHPSCVWAAPQTMPIDLDVHHPDPARQQQLDALMKAGLLTRKTTDKEIPAQDRHPRHRERVFEYTLTDTGKAAWSAGNPSPGAGNFCVGSPHVVSIDNTTPAPNTSRYSVSYRFALDPLPGWAQNADVQAAFPTIAAENNEKHITALAILSKTVSGWTPSAIQAIPIAPPPKTTP